MPALPAIANTYKIVLRYTNALDTLIINRLFFQVTDTGSTSDLNTFCTAIGTEWNSVMADRYHTSVTLVGVDVEDLTSSTAPVGTATVSHAGTLAGGPLSGGTAVVVSNHVARRYRGGKPRTYLPAGDSSVLDNPTLWNATFLSGLTSDWNTFIGYIASYSAGALVMSDQVNVSYYHGFTNFTYPSGRVKAIPTLRGTPVVDSIVSRFAQPQPGSQRRRNKTV